MRYLILSDLHGNLEALNSVLKFAKGEKIDHYLCLGDLVGYGASPNEVIDKVQALKPLSIIRGNHDKAVCESESLQSFNPIAAMAISWTQEHISEKNLDFLCEIKKGPQKVHDNITICHGAPFDEDYYIFGEFDAAEAFLHIETKITFFGHTHFPFVYKNKDHLVEGTYVSGNFCKLKLKKKTTYLINPGSLGQPRDRNIRSSCAIFDSESAEIYFHRLEYKIETTRKKILDAKLPPALAKRLFAGI